VDWIETGCRSFIIIADQAWLKKKKATPGRLSRVAALGYRVFVDRSSCTRPTHLPMSRMAPIGVCFLDFVAHSDGGTLRGGCVDSTRPSALHPDILHFLVGNSAEIAILLLSI